MPFEILRNDITEMKVDAIVNTVSSQPGIGWGVDAAIHAKAGARLRKAREAAGIIPAGGVAVTAGFDLQARYVIHTVAPLWQEGTQGEAEILRSCYVSALEAARRKNCTSIAFPLIGSGNRGMPKTLALQTAVSAISGFLMDHEMQVYLVVFSKDAVTLSEKLFSSVQSYIDEHYVREQTLGEYGIGDRDDLLRAERELFRRQSMRYRNLWEEFGEDCCASVSCEAMPPEPCAMSAPPLAKSAAPAAQLEDMLAGMDAGFSETLLNLIDASGKTDPEVYKKANVDRKLFSKIRKNPAYKPSKTTALAFAVALELDLAQTGELLARAGYTLTHASKLDIIVEYFITHGNYNIFEINETLFAFDQSPLGC